MLSVNDDWDPIPRGLQACPGAFFVDNLEVSIRDPSGEQVARALYSKGIRAWVIAALGNLEYLQFSNLNKLSAH